MHSHAERGKDQLTHRAPRRTGFSREELLLLLLLLIFYAVVQTPQNATSVQAERRSCAVG